ncbi:unnamed protein product [Somion occarium]|uniref:HIT domain-containing protein n=1 Tax=Somion occarium TaxID=3059160 RepID=A0ABP1DI62_9APHY
MIPSIRRDVPKSQLRGYIIANKGSKHNFFPSSPSGTRRVSISFQMSSDDKCLFCAIVKGAIPAFKVYETEHTLAFLDISPVSEGHTQVIPKYHARTLGDMPDEYLADIGPALKKVAAATGAEQYNVLQNNGKLAFQHVDHVHFHIIPKTTPQDGLVLDVDASWPARQADKEKLVATAEKMRSRI